MFESRWWLQLIVIECKSCVMCRQDYGLPVRIIVRVKGQAVSACLSVGVVRMETRIMSR